MRRHFDLVVLLTLAVSLSGCGINKSDRLSTNLASRSPDQSLSENATTAFAGQKYSVGITLLQTLTNTYPTSLYSEAARVSMAKCERIPECRVAHERLKSAGASGAMEFYLDMHN